MGEREREGERGVASVGRLAAGLLHAGDVFLREGGVQGFGTVIATRAAVVCWLLDLGRGGASTG